MTPHRDLGPSAPASMLVSMRGVTKRFASGVLALDGFSIDVRPGEFLSIVGPSGCGKSTALRILAGLASPTAGSVDWRDGPPVRTDIGFVFQEPTLMPWATVSANVRLPLKLAGVRGDGAEERVRDALHAVRLDEFADAYPRELSGGMRMRVSIARALVTRPKVLLMDEPFAALDEITRFRLNDELRALWQRLGMTVLFVTHSIFESVYLSERIVAMTARPGRAFADMVLESRDRGASFRTSAEYAAQCRAASALLEQAMEARP